tara:strand:- start:135 stop:875 length:741 start_codon:yes stop_codon:yes gene_type:complete
MPLSTKEFLASTLSKFTFNSDETLIKKLLSHLPNELLKIEDVKKNYFIKYKTKELIALIEKLAKKKIHRKEYIIIISIILILAKRYESYQIIVKNHSKKTFPEIIDDILFPPKILTNVSGTNSFTIVNWSQLNIEINDKEPKHIIFKKIIDGIPSDHKIIEKKLDDMRLGLTTRAILKTFGCLDIKESYNHPLRKKDQVFRLNKSLKNLFKIPSQNNPFFWKNNKLFTDITITAYDIDNTPVLPLK